jgi:hypothetical protein
MEKQIIDQLSKLKRYNCDVEVDFDDEETVNVVVVPNKNGEFVKWSDIQLILNKNEKF